MWTTCSCVHSHSTETWRNLNLHTRSSPAIFFPCPIVLEWFSYTLSLSLSLETNLNVLIYILFLSLPPSLPLSPCQWWSRTCWLKFERISVERERNWRICQCSTPELTWYPTPGVALCVCVCVCVCVIVWWVWWRSHVCHLPSHFGLAVATVSFSRRGSSVLEGNYGLQINLRVVRVKSCLPCVRV